MKPAKYENPSSMEVRTLSLKCPFRPDDEIEDGHPDAQHAESIRNHIILYARHLAAFEIHSGWLANTWNSPPPVRALSQWPLMEHQIWPRDSARSVDSQSCRCTTTTGSASHRHPAGESPPASRASN